MKWNITAFLVSIVVSKSVAFVSTTTRSFHKGVGGSSSRNGGSTIAEASAVTPQFKVRSSKSRMERNMAGDSSTTSPVETQFDIVKVDLTDGRDYPIYIGNEFDDVEAGNMIRSHIKGNRALLVTNDRVAPMHLAKYERLLNEGGDIKIDTLVIPDGEDNKTLEVINLILDKCLEEALDRKVTFIALGGGVIGDMVGFAAAIYQRGVNFIQIPTTVMAMVDSSVGGKTGVNHPLGKNMIGAFHQPQCVFIDTHTLATLPNREFHSGIAEVIKYGLIRDAPFFEFLEKNMEKLHSRDPETLRYIIKRSCENKAEVVKEDEKEAGVRATLNLGHTFGHAIENGSGYGSWLHGEAVAIGTVMATTMSARMGWIDEDLVKRTYDIFIAAKCPVELPVDSPMNAEIFSKCMSIDKKVANGQLRLILLKGELGNCVFTADFDKGAMKETIDDFVCECDGAQ